MNNESRGQPGTAHGERVREPELRRFAIALTRRNLPAPLIGQLLGALTVGESPELRAIFIEDDDLLNAVALPFIHELCVLTNAMRPIDRARLEAHFERESAAAAAGVKDLNRRIGRQCQFEVLRASKAHAMRLTIDGADAVLIPGAQAAALPGANAPLLALLDEGASAQHCLAVATRLAMALGASLEVHNVTPNATLLTALPALLARRDTRLVLLAATLLPKFARNLAELDEMCAAPLLVVN